MLAFARRLTQPTLRQSTLSLRRLSSKTAPPPPPPPRELSEGEQTILSKLKDRFSPSELLVQDISGGCGQFYAITIASEAFKGLSIVKQHRLVTETLKKEIEGIHGLQIKTIHQ